MAKRMNITFPEELYKDMQSISKGLRAPLIIALLKEYFKFRKKEGVGVYGYVAQGKFKMEKLNDN